VQLQRHFQISMQPVDRSFAIIAHRGFSSERPENTVSAFDHAVVSGFPAIELDVQLTSDGVPVVRRVLSLLRFHKIDAS